MSEFIRMLGDAIELEIEGHDFYVKCAERTKDKTGKDMFEFLAKEEVEHREKFEQEHRKHAGGDYSSTGAKESDIFKKEVKGAKADEKADELEALNIGIEAEKRSIEHYTKMLDETNDQATIDVLNGIVGEEEKHLAILNKEVEFVTETGEYTDFKVVTF